MRSNLLPFTFPSVGLEVVKHSFQRQGIYKAARGGLGSYEARSRLSNSIKLAVCSISACIERDSVELHDGSV